MNNIYFIPVETHCYMHQNVSLYVPCLLQEVQIYPQKNLIFCIFNPLPCPYMYPPHVPTVSLPCPCCVPLKKLIIPYVFFRAHACPRV